MILEKSIQNEIVKYIIKTPIALAVIFFSFISGYVWLYIILSWLKGNTNNKAVKHLNSSISKTALGIMWFAVIMYPCYLLKFGISSVELPKVFEIVWQTILIGLFVQGIITFIIIRFVK
ncbi:MAG: hypothetical protein REI64_10765 [Pedobacter sp.]|uniref:hypothetical protein n=1 Tax=Pedobacter sp. TaxID=1411316 RepID=UPI0028088008|nr:hypothetical protein [Pedobacter sp.]MDQ8005272.1 hypothetical protein [Pedobacter sp.]